MPYKNVYPSPRMSNWSRSFINNNNTKPKIPEVKKYIFNNNFDYNFYFELYKNISSNENLLILNGLLDIINTSSTNINVFFIDDTNTKTNITNFTFDSLSSQIKINLDSSYYNYGKLHFLIEVQQSFVQTNLSKKYFCIYDSNIQVYTP